MKDLQAILRRYQDPENMRKAIDNIATDIVEGRIILGELRNQAQEETERDRQMFEYLKDHTLAQTARYFCLAKETVRKFALKNHLR